jgi:hypothetical protein
MSFFQAYFGIVGERQETAVCCPFPHRTPGTNFEYYEQHPSAHVNIDSGVFHCKVCGQGHSEQSFIMAKLGCSFGDAMRFARIFQSTEDIFTWDEELTLTDEMRQQLNALGISNATIEELHIKTGPNGIAFPVFMYNTLVDIRTYTPDQKPKMRSRLGAIAGLILPFDIWRESPKQRVTLICAGEKDMAVARSHGFNAITLTGGEGALPVNTHEFAGRKVVIVYDNDAAGKAGAIKLATFLKPIALSVKNCTGFHEICHEDREDITDFFVKYNKQREDLIQYIADTPEFEIPPELAAANYPVMDLLTASKPQYIGRMVKSNIQVVATSEASFTIPSNLIGEKMRASDTPDDQMRPGEIKEWILSENTVQDILHMMDNNFKESDIEKHYRDILKIMQKERYVKIRKPAKETIFKCYVTDMFETTNMDVTPMEFTAYTVGMKLESGKKYLATYKLVPHPYKGQQLVMLITDAHQASDSVSNFIITDAVKDNLRVIQNLEGTVAEKIENITERFKSILGYNGNNTLIQCIDFSFHTVLQFHFGQFRNMRGYLDTIIIGESRVGKSSTAEAMRKTYGLGTFASLAGNAATIPGLIGGSNKVNGSYQTRAGIIPQNHKGLIIFEELGKSNSSIIAELTDIRSSNEVRITRVSGTLTLPAAVRMVALTNVKASDGVIKPIASYPHGISILSELVGTAEDIARYDIILILSDRGNTHIDPFWTAPEHFDEGVYKSRIRWIWSRNPNNIIIREPVGRYIVEQANAMNQLYDSHIKIFGTEAWKKIARLAVTVAGYVVSTDDSFENIIVEPEHVDYAVAFLRKIYDNPTFRLKEYVEHERKYATIDDDGVALLQDVFIKCPALLYHLEQVDRTTKNTLQAATGMTNEQYNAQINRLVAGMFVTFNKYDIIPTERFRLGMARINRNTRATRVGEAL